MNALRSACLCLQSAVIKGANTPSMKLGFSVTGNGDSKFPVILRGVEKRRSHYDHRSLRSYSLEVRTVHGEEQKPDPGWAPREQKDPPLDE